MTRHSLWMALAAVVVCMCSLPALAEKITVDPNTVKQETEEETQATDSRLAQKVAFEAQRKSVLSILTDLSAQTGVAMKAGQNSKDWQVRDRKMNVFAKDVPLASLMNSMARVMKFKWSREGKEGDYVYRLYMDRKSLLDAESQLQREEERLRREQQEQREKTFKAFADLANMKPEEIEKLKDSNPFLYMAAKSGLGESLGGFLSQVPSAMEALATGQEFSVNAAALSAGAQQGLAQSIRGLAKLERTLGGRSDFQDDSLNNMAAVTVSINSSMEEMRGRPEASFMLGMIEMRCEGRNYGVPLMDPDSSMAKMIGKLVATAMDEGKTMQEVAKSEPGMQSEFMKAVMADMKKTDYGEKPVEHADEPALHEKITIEPKSGMLNDVQSALAAGAKMSVVSDYFGRANGMGGMGGAMGEQKDVELKTALDRIGDTFRYNWDKHGSVIEFRNKDWYRKRAAQIPDAWIEGWRTTLKDTGTLDLGDLAQMAVLDLEQFSMNVMDDPTLMASNIAGSIFPNREVLRLYAALSESQRAAIFSETGLDLRSLAPDQWKQAQKLIASRNSAYLQNDSAGLTAAGTRKAKDKRFEYTITITCPDQEKPIELKLTTPEYKEPPKETPKDQPKADTPKEAKPAEQPAAAK